MPTITRSTEIDGVVMVDHDEHRDVRGSFVETWRKEWFKGVPDMVQANRSDKVAGSVVAFHYHLRQADYWYVVAGAARVVLHDLRTDSATSGATITLEMNGSSQRAVYIPPGVAHGFSALTDLVLWYLVDHPYDPEDELGVAWDDPDLGVDWGVGEPVISERDRHNPRRADIPPDRLPSKRHPPDLP